MDPKIIASFVAFTGTIIVASITIYTNYKIRQDSKRMQKSARFIDRKIIHQQKLSEFYIPLRHYLENSKTLFKIFMKDKPEGFRTLTHFLDPKQVYGKNTQPINLNKNDVSILKKIFEIGEKMESLIYDKGYLIGDDTEFVEAYKPIKKYKNLPYERDMTILSLLISHIVVIRLANEGDLTGDIDKFKGFVFPNEINQRINDKIKVLENKIKICESLIFKIQ